MIATRQALAQPNTREANPFLQNKNAALGISIAAAVATVTASELLQRTHHHKLAIAVPAILGAEAWAVSGWNWSAARSGVGPCRADVGPGFTRLAAFRACNMPG